MLISAASRKEKLPQPVDHPDFRCRGSFGLNYSRFMNGIKKAGVEMNRKSLSEMAIQDPAAFAAVVELAKKAL